MSVGRTSRWVLAWILPLLLLVGIQTALVFREDIFSPIDELQHVDYVRTIALEARFPILALDEVDPGLRAIYFHRGPHDPLPPTASQSISRWSYEAVQFPLYYLTMAPVYKLLASHPRAAIYAMRFLNVLLSAVLFVLIVRLNRHVFRLERMPATMVALGVLLIPGVALRNSQVINELLAAVVIGVLLTLAMRVEVSSVQRRSILEGGVLGLAILTKLTAIAFLPALVYAWLSRAQTPRRQVALGLLGLLGLAIPFLPWLAWALPHYGGPLPFQGAPPQIFDPSQFAPPATAAKWVGFLGTLIHGFWLPEEWHPPARTGDAVTLAAVLIGMAVFAAALASAGAFLVRGRPDASKRAVQLVLLTLAAFFVSYALFATARHRFWKSDLRELYVFLAPIAVLFGGLAARLGTRVATGAFAGLTIAWLVADFFLFVLGSCPGCP